MGANTSLNIPAKGTGPEMTPGLSPNTETVTVKTTPTGVAVTSNSTTDPKITETPGLILGKFKTQAEFETAYKALETKLGSGAPSTETVTPPASTTPPALTIENATKVLTDKGLDYTKFALEYAAKGALSSESYQAIFAKGITAQEIDSFITAQAPVIAAQKAKMETERTDIISSVGTQEEFTKLLTYVKDAGSPEEIASYNRAIDAGDRVAAKLLLANFKAQYETSLGKEPTLNGGKPPSGPAGEVYQNLDQYHEDLGSGKYRLSPSFRHMVDAKIARSTHLYSKK